MASIITMPRLSPTMEEGVLAKWTKKVGDKIMPGDVIAEVETDKANMEFPLEDEGVLLKLLVEAGATVKLGAPVAILGEAGEDPSSVKLDEVAAPAPAPANESAPPSPKPAASPSPKPAASPSPKPKPAAPPSSEAPAAPSGNGAGRVKASPLARKIADEKGVDLHGLTGSGPGGRIVKRDVLDAKPPAARAPALRSVETREDRVVPASQMRKTIARRLVEAKREIPHIYLTAEATVDALFAVRAQINAALPIKISVNDLVVKALAVALRHLPEANVSWTEAGIVQHGRVDIGVAVSLPDGLITPVVRDADDKPLGALSSEIKELAERARVKKLQPAEYTGATASVSNLGMYGVREFVAIINPPESLILAVGAIEKRAIVIEKEGGDEIKIARRMTLTISCDHRTVDGVLGAKVLAEVVRLLENPFGMLV